MHFQLLVLIMFGLRIRKLSEDICLKPQFRMSRVQIQKVKFLPFLKEFGILSNIKQFVVQFYRYFKSFNSQMQSKKLFYVVQQSKINISINQQAQIKITKGEHENPVENLIKKETHLKKNLAFWNSLVEGRFQSVSSSINLFILLLMITLGSQKYNGDGTNGSWVLGWIMITQVSFTYTLIFLLKFMYIPSLVRQLQENSTEGFKLYNYISNGRKIIKNLNVQELQLLEKTIKQQGQEFKQCFPSASTEIILAQIKTAYGHNYHEHRQLKKIKSREKDAKYWQTFWQNFAISKTFSIPSVMLLVFIIAPHSIATVAYTSKETNNAQGWIAMSVWAAAIVVFVIIKFIAWDYLDNKVNNTKSQPFLNYHLINIKRKEFASLSLSQLQDIQYILNHRLAEFQACFPDENSSSVLKSVEAILKQRLPNRGVAQQVQLKRLVLKERELHNAYSSWMSFFNLRLIPTIINSLKFLIVAVNTFLGYYPSTAADLQKAKITVGSIGIGVFVLGYLLYIFLKAFYLDYLQEKVYEGRSSPFTTYRLVYFGNKNFADLQVHQLEDISDAITLRKDQFENCFPKASTEKLIIDIKAVIKEKQAPFQKNDKIKDLLKEQEKAKKMVAFWSGFVDSHLMTSMYSFYVLLVLLMVSLTSIYENVPDIMGWVGVANLGVLIFIVIFFKTYLIEYMTNSTKALRVDGYSEFNLVYSKTKQLKEMQISQLQKIVKIVDSNPLIFRKCFPKAALQQTLHDIQQAITFKSERQKNKPILSARESVKCQLLKLQLSRCKTALATWSNIMRERLFVITPISIVIHILWGQSIAKSLYGITVCGYLTVASLAVIILLILFYNLYYHKYLENRIKKCEDQIIVLQTKRLQV